MEYKNKPIRYVRISNRFYILIISSVDGVVEADEGFFAYSYKGTKPVNMPRLYFMHRLPQIIYSVQKKI